MFEISRQYLARQIVDLIIHNMTHCSDYKFISSDNEIIQVAYMRYNSLILYFIAIYTINIFFNIYINENFCFFSIIVLVLVSFHSYIFFSILQFILFHKVLFSFFPLPHFPSSFAFVVLLYIKCTIKILIYLY